MPTASAAHARSCPTSASPTWAMRCATPTSASSRGIAGTALTLTLPLSLTPTPTLTLTLTLALTLTLTRYRWDGEHELPLCEGLMAVELYKHVGDDGLGHVDGRPSAFDDFESVNLAANITLGADAAEMHR